MRIDSHPRRRRGALAAVVLGAVTAGVVGPAPSLALADAECDHGCVAAFATPGHSPFGVARGSHDEEWISLDSELGAFGPEGQDGAVAIPAANPNAGWITSDRRGGLWFAERGTGMLGHLDEHRAVKEYPLGGQNAVPQGIVVMDDAVYVAEQGRNAVARLEPSSGAVTEFAVPTPNATVLGLALGADGALWFTERSAAKIGRITPAGTITEYALASGAYPVRIVAGPDGALWFTELKAKLLGRITTDGRLTEFPAPGGPAGITVGEDHQLYVVDFGSRDLSRYDLAGRRTGTWALPGASGPLVVATGRDHQLWVADTFGGMVYVVQPGNA